MAVLESLFEFQRGFLASAVRDSGSLLKAEGVLNVAEKELASGKAYPVLLKTDFSLLIDAIPALNQAHKTLDKIAEELWGDFRKLLASGSFDEFNSNLGELIHVDALKDVPEVVRGIIHMQAGLALSFASVVGTCRIDMNDYADSFNQYFFTKEGYKTVSGDLITRPQFPKNLAEVHKICKPVNAEQYIRDTVRIIVDTGGNSIYETKRRYGELEKKYKNDASKKKLVEWFDSFGDTAEASVLPVVEEVLNGALGVELNPLLAAAVGTFFSVAARKATEHCYLTLLGFPISSPIELDSITWPGKGAGPAKPEDAGGFLGGKGGEA